MKIEKFKTIGDLLEITKDVSENVPMIFSYEKDIKYIIEFLDECCLYSFVSIIDFVKINETQVVHLQQDNVKTMTLKDFRNCNLNKDLLTIDLDTIIVLRDYIVFVNMDIDIIKVYDKILIR